LNNIKIDLNNAVGILKTEGWFAVIKRGLRHVFYSKEYYYIYEKDLREYLDVRLNPNIECEFKIVSNFDDFNELVKQKYNFDIDSIKPKLKTGAIGFCIFVEKTLASITWVAQNEKAKKLIDILPFAVDYTAGEVCSGGSYTDPKYRGNGLLKYDYSYIFKYLKDHGCTKDKFTVNMNNIPSNTAMSKFQPKIIGEGCNLKVLLWKKWTQKTSGKVKYDSSL